PERESERERVCQSVYIARTLLPSLTATTNHDHDDDDVEEIRARRESANYCCDGLECILFVNAHPADIQRERKSRTHCRGNDLHRPREPIEKTALCPLTLQLQHKTHKQRRRALVSRDRLCYVSFVTSKGHVVDDNDDETILDEADRMSAIRTPRICFSRPQVRIRRLIYHVRWKVPESFNIVFSSKSTMSFRFMDYLWNCTSRYQRVRHCFNVCVHSLIATAGSRLVMTPDRDASKKPSCARVVCMHNTYTHSQLVNITIIIMRKMGAAARRIAKAKKKLRITEAGR
ncbi:unnamed protein product, partial [Trichogramma brassicae]